MNRQNMKLLIEHLESPRNSIGWDMGSFFTHNEVEIYGRKNICEVVETHSCGTAACIAGHAAWLAWDRGDIVPTRYERSVEDDATAWLDLDEIEADRLFYGRWTNINLPSITLEDAIAHLKTLR